MADAAAAWALSLLINSPFLPEAYPVDLFSVHPEKRIKQVARTLIPCFLQSLTSWSRLSECSAGELWMMSAVAITIR